MGNKPSSNGINVNTVSNYPVSDITTDGHVINSAIKSVCQSVLTSSGVATNSSLADINSTVSGLSSTVSTIQGQIGNLATKASVNNINTSVSAVQTQVTTLQTQMTTLQNLVLDFKQTSGAATVTAVGTVNTNIPTTAQFIKTGKSLMMWGEVGISSGLMDDVVTITITSTTPSFNYATGSTPSVQVTQMSSNGDSSFSLGLQTSSITAASAAGPLQFKVQSFGAKPYRFTWFATGVSQ